MQRTHQGRYDVPNLIRDQITKIAQIAAFDCRGGCAAAASTVTARGWTRLTTHTGANKKGGHETHTHSVCRSLSVKADNNAEVAFG